MGSTGIIDLYSLPFWGSVATALAVMIPIIGAKPRRLAFSLINLGFLGYFLRADLLAVLIGVCAVYLFLRFIEENKSSRVWLAFGGFVSLVLFVAHKLPAFGKQIGRWNPILTTVGFSYVALRLVEVGRAVASGRHRAPSLVSLIDYLLPFHMLSAGPIQSYDEFVAQPASPPALGPAAALASVERIGLGMFKKFVLANALQAAFLTSLQSKGPYFFLEVQINYIWLYLDFSAYSDIAVGIGTLLGVATPENFKQPYLAVNIIDYWERWHISLSQWIRRNLFIPIQLALMRKTSGRHPLLIASFAFAVSFLLCGLWHNIGFNWLAWGAYHAAGLILCNLYRNHLIRALGRKGYGRYRASPWIRVISTVLTFEFVAFSLILVTHP